jgi:LAO/AO transport system kinase
MNYWIKEILSGNVRALARAATWTENEDPRAAEILSGLPPSGGEALVVGITGPPGAGKSTLVDRLARLWRARGKTVGILAVDPSSRISGGAILGDRVRMQSHHADPGIFIRSMASRGVPGGIARKTADLVRLIEASGKDVILVETVGAGQAEVEIARLAGVVVVVLVPGLGDDIQAIKAGIMEIATVFALNKADHHGAEQLEREIHAAGWTAPVVRTVATEGDGVEALLEAVEAAPRRREAVQPNAGGMAIDHLGIAVESIERALAFYRDRLGLAVARNETVEAERVRVAMLPLGESRIELLEPVTPDSPIGRFLEKRGPGLHHVTLAVADLSAAVERLRAGGARLLNEPRRGAGGHLYVFVHPASTGGVLLELVERRSGT